MTRRSRNRNSFMKFFMNEFLTSGPALVDNDVVEEEEASAMAVKTKSRNAKRGSISARKAARKGGSKLHTYTLKKHVGAVGPKTAKKKMAGRTVSPVEKLRSAWGLPRSKFARLVGHTERAIINWEKSVCTPQGLAGQRLTELERLRAGLAEVMKEDAIPEWLETPNPAFGDLKPTEVIERGQIDRVWKLVFDLQSGAFS